MENEIQQNTPPIQPSPHTPTSAQIQTITKWSTVLLFTILGLILGTVLVFVGIQIGKSQTQDKHSTSSIPVVINPTTLPTQTTNYAVDPAENWKIFKNDKYGITFSYPNNYTVENELTRNNGSFLYEIRSPFDAHQDAEMRGTTGLSENELNIAFVFAKNSSSMKLDDYLFEFKKKTLLDGFSKIIKTESIDINYQKIYLLTIQRPQSPVKKTVLLLNNDIQVEITMEPVGSNRETEFSKILSTFKFTK